MFTELLQTELWRKKLEAAGYKVVSEVWRAPYVERASPDEPRAAPPRIAQPAP